MGLESTRTISILITTSQMKISIFFAIFSQLAIGSTIGDLANSDLHRLLNRIRTVRTRRVIKRTYFQCVTGFRNPETDRYCQQVAFLITYNY